MPDLPTFTFHRKDSIVPGPQDAFDYFTVLMLDNRAFDNLLG